MRFLCSSLALLLTASVCFGQAFTLQRPFLYSQLQSTPIPQLTNLFAYYDSLDLTNWVVSGTNVTTWINKMNASMPAVSTNAVLPSWSTNAGPGGYGKVNFFGAQWFIFTNIAVKPWTVACLFNCALTNKCVPWGNDRGADIGPGLFDDTTDVPLGLKLLQNGTRATFPLTCKGVSVNNYYVVVSACGLGSNTPSMLWTNGVLAASNTNGTAATNDLTWRIGRMNDSSTHRHQGSISRLMFWTGYLDSNECNQVYYLFTNDYKFNPIP